MDCNRSKGIMESKEAANGGGSGSGRQRCGGALGQPGVVEMPGEISPAKGSKWETGKSEDRGMGVIGPSQCQMERIACERDRAPEKWPTEELHCIGSGGARHTFWLPEMARSLWG